MAFGGPWDTGAPGRWEWVTDNTQTQQQWITNRSYAAIYSGMTEEHRPLTAAEFEEAFGDLPTDSDQGDAA